MNANEKKAKAPKSVKKILISIGSIFILVLAAISFIVIPAMVQGTGKKLPAFGKYNGKAIEYTQNSKMAYYMTMFAEQYKQQGRQIDDSSYYSLLSNAFNYTAINMAFTDEVNASGYVVSENAVDRAMIPYFYDENGKYSSRLYKNTPDAEKIRMRNDIRENLIYQRYAEDVFGKNAMNNGIQTGDQSGLYGLKTSSKEIDFIKKMGDVQRSFDMAYFSTNDYPKTKVREYGEQNKDLFAKYNLSVINADTESEAKDILKRIKNNEITFEDAVKELSTKTYSSDDGKLFSNYKYQLKNILFEEASLDSIDNVKANEYSEIIKLKNGYGFFRCDDVVTEANLDDNALLDDILTYIKTNETGIIEDYYINTAKDLATAAITDGFNKASEAFGATIVEVPAFPINYANNQLIATVPSDVVSQLSGAQFNESFLKTAFSLKAKEVSAPIVIGSNIVVLQLKEEIQAENSTGDTMNFMYPYYVSQFDQAAISKFFMSSKKLENNLFDVYFNNILKD